MPSPAHARSHDRGWTTFEKGAHSSRNLEPGGHWEAREMHGVQRRISDKPLSTVEYQKIQWELCTHSSVLEKRYKKDAFK